MNYRAVLDPSAVAAYAASSEHLGELLSELADEQIRFAVPAICLIEAIAAGADEDRLRLLLAHPYAAVVDLDGNDWARLGAGTRLLGSTGRACAALLHVDGDAGYVATRNPDIYGDGIDTIPIVD